MFILSPTKVCTKCGLLIPATTEFFYKKERGLYGLCSWCKSCHSKITIPNVLQWQKAHPERARANSKRWTKQHPEKSHQWDKTHPEQKRIHKRNRDACKQKAEGIYTIADIELQVKAQTNSKGQLICWWCDKPIKSKYHIEHRIPLARGGSNDARNIVLAHPKCNLSKGAKLPSEWIGRLL